MVKYFQETKTELGKDIQIFGTDLTDSMIQKAKENVEYFGLQDSIHIFKEDFLLAPIESFDIVYTTAAVNDVFNWKIVYFSVACEATYIFFSQPMAQTFNNSIVDFEIIKICNGYLATFNPNHNGNKRDIMMINVKYLLDKTPNLLEIVSEYGQLELESQFNRTLDHGIFQLFDQSILNIGDIISWNQIDRNNKLPYFSSLDAYRIEVNESVEAKKNALKNYFDNHKIEIIRQIFL